MPKNDDRRLNLPFLINILEFHWLTDYGNSIVTDIYQEGSEVKPHMKHSSYIVLLIGLIMMAAGFTMLDRGWLQDLIPQIGPVTHPMAALVGLIGFAIFLIGAAALRHEKNSGHE